MAASSSPAAEGSLAGETLDSFYASRGDRPLWFGRYGNSGAAPQLLIDLLRTAWADGLDPERYRPRNLERAVRVARSGNPNAIARADRMLSEALVAYVRDTKSTPKVDMIWVDAQLRPSAPPPRRLLDQAAAAESLENFLANMRWMHPIYVGLRQALVGGVDNDPSRRDLLRLNLERARSLPSSNGKYVLVNATSAQLAMYEGGEIVDTMRVVVGRPVHQTPMLAALIRFASLNPYWNVPADLAAERVAPNVVKHGQSYLNAKGYQLLSSWEPDAHIVDPGTVDWATVAKGETKVRLRQLPGPSNAMGKMKFMFPNSEGIYLHDTPEKDLLGEETRMFSGGCVRLEDAPRLARWLFGGKAPATKSARPEQRVDLPTPVPVFLTYLTAIPNGATVSYLPDVYDRDRAALAALDGPATYASR